MTTARKHFVDEMDPLTWGPPLRAALSETLLEAMAQVPKAGAEEMTRKWLAHLRNVENSAALDDLIAEASVLSLELAVYAPSFSGVRPIDRLARKSEGRTRDHALAPELLKEAKFRLFRILALERDSIYRARDLATGEMFLIFEHRLAPTALDIDLAARICPVLQGLSVLVGPMIPLGFLGAASANEFIRPGKGLVNDQRCAAQVYRDYIRSAAGGGLNFGLRTEISVTLSHAEDELDAFARDWFQSGDGPTPTGDALAEARNLASTPRVIAALSTCVEYRRAGLHKLAGIYRGLAAVFLETLQERARVGSGDLPSLEALRAHIAKWFAGKKILGDVSALFEELARPLRVQAASSALGNDDLARVVERIRALRAKTTEQGCTEQEALRAAEKVAEMLERYGLSLSEIEMRGQTCQGFGVDTGRRKREPSDRCLPAIAEFCDCRAWSETSATSSIRHVFFGLPADVEAAHYLYDLVAVAFSTETETFKRGELFSAMLGPARRGAVASFQIGLAAGIADKLAALKAARQAAMFKSSGRDLMPVKASILDEELEKLGLSFETKRGKRRRKVVAAAYAEGQAAGERFEVHAGIK